MAFNLKELQIKSKNSADDKQLQDNIKVNYDLINQWISPSEKHDLKALMVSGGVSTDEYMVRIKAAADAGYQIFCVKHSLPKLLKAGIVPEGVFILDPRTAKGYSTHGEVREDLYKDVPESVVFFVASMTSPDVTKNLIEQGLNIVGWNANVTGLSEYLQHEKIDTLVFNYGTSSATRALGVIQMLGFNHIEMVGFDGNVSEPTEKEKRERNIEGPHKYVQVVDPETGKTYWSTGELLAQVQDMETLVNIYKGLVDVFDMWPGGIGYLAFKSAVQKRTDTLENKLTGLPTMGYTRQMDLFRAKPEYKASINIGDKLIEITDSATLKTILGFLNISNL